MVAVAPSGHPSVRFIIAVHVPEKVAHTAKAGERAEGAGRPVATTALSADTEQLMLGMGCGWVEEEGGEGW